MESRVFDDDDPVDRTPRPMLEDQHSGEGAAEASDGGAVALATYCEYSNFACSLWHRGRDERDGGGGGDLGLGECLRLLEAVPAAAVSFPAFRHH